MKAPRFALLALLIAAPVQAAPKPHNVLVFVADGLRYVSVTQKTAPTLWRNSEIQFRMAAALRSRQNGWSRTQTAR